MIHKSDKILPMVLSAFIGAVLTTVGFVYNGAYALPGVFIIIVALAWGYSEELGL